MSDTAVFHTTVTWQGAHWGHLAMGNGPEMPFSAPPEAHGHAGVLTPEDAFVAAINTCIMMMFIWAAERYRLDLRHYSCRAEGTRLVQLDRTEQFTEVKLWPRITVASGEEDPAVTRQRVHKALQSAQKYSLVANSVTANIVIEPTIELAGVQRHAPSS